MTDPLHVVVGRVGRAHGVRGDVVVDVRTDEPERRLAPGAVLATEPDRGPLTVASGRVHSGRLLLHFEGIDDRAAAEALKGAALLAEVDPDERPDDADEWYDRQLVGLRVAVAAQGAEGAADPEGGPEVGAVTEVLHTPYQDLLVVALDTGGEALVPFVAEIAVEVDVAAGRILIDPPPGLLGDPAEG